MAQVERLQFGSGSKVTLWLIDCDSKMTIDPEMEFKEFEPWFKSAKTRFKLSAGLNLETCNTILSGANHI